MVDCFDVLGLPRRASLTEDALHLAYTSRSRATHPDHGGTEEAAAQVNAAYETLRTPERRLKHLLEIAGPEEARAWRTVPLDDGMMAVFGKLGKTMDDSHKFIERKAKAQTALAKALLAGEEMNLREALEGIGFEIQDRRDALERELPEIDSALAGGEVDGWKRLAAIQARLAYLGRWQSQVRERLLALM